MVLEPMLTTMVRWGLIGEMRGSGYAGKQGTSIEGIGGGPSRADKPAWLYQDLLESVSSSQT